MLRNPITKKAYDDLGLEFELVHLLINKRLELGLTQQQLADRIGTKQSAISRLESGNFNPSLMFAQKVANALGAKLYFGLL